MITAVEALLNILPTAPLSRGLRMAFFCSGSPPLPLCLLRARIHSYALKPSLLNAPITMKVKALFEFWAENEAELSQTHKQQQQQL